MPLVRVPDGALYYQRVGQGPPVLLVNEWPFSHRYWGPLVDRLKSMYEVIRFDPRGIGRSRSFPPDAPYDVEAHAEDLHELIRSLGLGEVHLVAHALGAVPAAVCLRFHPQDVRTLAIFNPLVRPEQPQLTGKQLTSAQILLLSKKLAAVPLLSDLLLRRYAVGRLPKPYRRILAEDLLDTDVRAAWALIHSATEEVILREVLAALREFPRPVLIVACRRDARASLETARWIFDRIRSGMLVTLTASAHFPMLDAPETVSRVLAEFYRKAHA